MASTTGGIFSEASCDRHFLMTGSRNDATGAVGERQEAASRSTWTTRSRSSRGRQERPRRRGQLPIAGFPPSPLADPAASVEAAGSKAACDAEGGLVVFLPLKNFLSIHKNKLPEPLVARFSRSVHDAVVRALRDEVLAQLSKSEREAEVEARVAPQINRVHVRAAPQRRLDDALVAVLRAYYCDRVAVDVSTIRRHAPQQQPFNILDAVVPRDEKTSGHVRVGMSRCWCLVLHRGPRAREAVRRSRKFVSDVHGRRGPAARAPVSTSAPGGA